MTAAGDLREASIGAAKPQSDSAAAGLEWDHIANHLTQAAAALRAASLTGLAAQTAIEISDRLTVLAAPPGTTPNLEDLERNLTVLEEKFLNALIATTSEADLTALREQSAQELAPYRRRMQAMQIRQIEQQFLHKRLLEKHNLPRLSLFYMKQD
jgi:hypothetical protein